MIEREHAGLSLTRQCRLLELSRSSLYYRPVGESAQTLALMRRIDELYLQYPFYGSRQMVRHLAREGVRVGRHRVRRLMRLLGLEAIYRKPRTSVANPEHRVYPYLLRGLTIERPNQIFVLLVGVRIERGAESAAEVAPERVEPDVFPGQRVGTMHVEFAAALGLTDVGPVGGAVAGTGEAVGLHEGLQQERSVAVASLPVVGQPAAAVCQHRGSEIAHLHPGQDQEAGVVHDQLQAGFALGNAPAD